jgi:hypothetical protein
LGEKYETEDYPSTDWECCGEMIPARKTRCGKCRGWRGGKRRVRWTYEGLPVDDASVDGEADIDRSIDWTCKKCNKVNKGEKKRCADCAGWRFSRKKARTTTGDHDDSDDDEDETTGDSGHWICKACSYDNFSTELQCLMCQKYRPNWKKYSDALPSNDNSSNEALTDSLSAVNKATAEPRQNLSGNNIVISAGVIPGLSIADSTAEEDGVSCTPIEPSDLDNTGTEPVQNIESNNSAVDISNAYVHENHVNSDNVMSSGIDIGDHSLGNVLSHGGSDYFDGHGGFDYGSSYLHHEFDVPTSTSL